MVTFYRPVRAWADLDTNP
ncbi:hypothetical protein LINPERPRIM_LOCUS8842 [Linum perenne]